jgi:hypothetical protein
MVKFFSKNNKNVFKHYLKNLATNFQSPQLMTEIFQFPNLTIKNFQSPRLATAIFGHQQFFFSVVGSMVIVD